MAIIKDNKEFEDRLKQLCRFYRAVRSQFAQVEFTEETAPRLVITAGKIVDKITEALSDIELYAGAADIRLINRQMRDIREKRESKDGG